MKVESGHKQMLWLLEYSLSFCFAKQFNSPCIFIFQWRSCIRIFGDSPSCSRSICIALRLAKRLNDHFCMIATLNEAGRKLPKMPFLRVCVPPTVITVVYCDPKFSNWSDNGAEKAKDKKLPTSAGSTKKKRAHRDTGKKFLVSQSIMHAYYYLRKLQIMMT